MSMKQRIDGSTHTGTYRVECECGDSWTGQGEAIGAANWSPALPIAECVCHMKMVHPNIEPEVVFSARFSQWLLSYWERASLRLQQGGRVTAFTSGSMARP